VLRRHELFEELRRVKEDKGLLQVILMLTDIGRKGSHVWFVGDRRDVFENALGRRLIDDGIYAEDCMSRKKRVVPALEQAFCGRRRDDGVSRVMVTAASRERSGPERNADADRIAAISRRPRDSRSELREPSVCRKWRGGVRRDGGSRAARCIEGTSAFLY